MLKNSTNIITKFNSQFNLYIKIKIKCNNNIKYYDLLT